MYGLARLKHRLDWRQNTSMKSFFKTRGSNSIVALVLLVLAGCGGGGDTAPAAATPETCTASAQKDWLRSYMNDAYFWAGLAPSPAPKPEQTLAGYFPTLLFQGDAQTPADRWSYLSDRVAYSQFFDEGQTLGYGIAVNGLEAQLPLKIRYVEPASPAARAGLLRGDEILALNGVTSAQLMALGDYSALNASQANQTLTLQIATAQGSKTVSVMSATYAITPVPLARVFDLPNGTRVAYLLLKDFVDQAREPLADAFASFRSAGATELVVDLRYNGGGLVSVANVLASLVAGQSRSGELFTALVYNPLQHPSNQNYYLDGQWPGFSRVVLLNGRRTCSASELLANGLKPHVQVVMLGEPTCGKPLGFLPVDQCDITVSAVNFEAVNALGQGRYFDGLAPTCAVAEDFSEPLGDPAEKMLAAASSYLVSGKCPGDAAAALQGRALSLRAPPQRPIFEPERFPGMRAN